MQNASTQQFIPLELETRPTVDTAAYAHYMHIAPQTARIHACKESGPIRPIRIPGTAKLHWPVEEIRRVLGIAPLQRGFIDLAYLMCILGAGLLLQVILMAWPGLLAGLDWTGIAMLGAGVIRGQETRTYYNLTELAAAAKAKDCQAHLHIDGFGTPIFSLGNSNTGAREFDNFDAAMAYLEVNYHDNDLEYIAYLEGLSTKEVLTAPSKAEFYRKQVEQNSEFNCPICQTETTMMNVGRKHYSVCHADKIFWPIGSNLFSAWRDEDPAVWEANKKLLAGYTDRSKTGSDSQIVNIAMQAGVGHMVQEDNRKKPIVKFDCVTNRPASGTLGDVLQEVAAHQPTGFTRINGYSEAWWRGVEEGEPDQLELRMGGATACFEDTNAVVIFIRESVHVKTARSILKAAVRELKNYPSLECSTPLVPASDQEVPF